MPYREMLRQKADLFAKTSAQYQVQEDEISVVQSFIKSQNPLMIGMFALMGLNLLILVFTVQ
ncbi:MAG: hypothetical protein VKJ04_01270 [Vampirovibrionales bacterium]|nr:hypothetical protein [Vampirovibrionales bacterium]